MVQLEIKDYCKVEEPIKKVTINNLFAQAVIEKKVNGFIYVNQVHTPRTFYVIHPYHMTLLFGNTDNEAFNIKFHEYALNKPNNRNHYEWMQAFPRQWDNTLLKLFNNHLVHSSQNENGKDKIELNTRVNFKFQPESYKSAILEHADCDIKIVRTNRKMYQEMPGSVVPKYFWNNADHFIKDGIGFSLIYKNQLASTAYSAFVQGNKLELGIETAQNFRGKGFAQLTCSALIDYCLENNFEPIWSCRLENLGSYLLAHKLGFKPMLEIPYYRLCN